MGGLTHEPAHTGSRPSRPAGSSLQTRPAPENPVPQHDFLTHSPAPAPGSGSSSRFRLSVPALGSGSRFRHPAPPSGSALRLPAPASGSALRLPAPPSGFRLRPPASGTGSGFRLRLPAPAPASGTDFAFRLRLPTSPSDFAFRLRTPLPASTPASTPASGSGSPASGIWCRLRFRRSASVSWHFGLASRPRIVGTSAGLRPPIRLSHEAPTVPAFVVVAAGFPAGSCQPPSSALSSGSPARGASSRWVSW